MNAYGKKLLLLSISFIFITSLSAQTIEGFITSSEGDTLVVGNVLFKEARQPKSIREFTIARNGIFAYSLKKEYDTLLIEIKSMGYVSQSILVESPEAGKNYRFDIIMDVDTKELEEITVETSRRFEERGDTLIYEAEAFKDGSERKVEDLLKKLPGVEVNEQTGAVKYKGKPVETVMLEGDDLFGQNYTLGTRNINVDMVEQVEAIENYNANPLLKDVDSGEKVALNLKLKKGKMDFSGDVDAGIGALQDPDFARHLNANILSITKSYKSFATLAHNNVGINHSPFDYFSFSLNAEQLQERNNYAHRELSETIFSNFLDDRLANVNDQYFGNYNAIFRPNKRSSIKINLYALTDEIENEQFSQNEFFSLEDTFTTTDEISIQKRPTQYRGDLEIKYNTSKNSLLEYKGKIRYENINTPTLTIQNRQRRLRTVLETNDLFSKQHLLFTQKLNKQKVLQFTALHTYNDIPQVLEIKPSVLDNLGINRQESQFSRSTTNIKATLLGARKSDRYVLEMGFRNESNPFESSLYLLESDEERELIAQNDLSLRQNSFYQLGAYHFSYRKWKLSPTYSLTLLSQNLEPNIEERETLEARHLIFEPAINIRYKLNRVSSLNGKIGYNRRPNEIQNLFTGGVLQSARQLVNNTPSLDLQNTLSYSLFYFNNDMYHQFDMQAGFMYQRTRGNFFSNFELSPTLNTINSFFLDEEADRLDVNFKVGKYIDFIQTTLRVDANYSISNYKNIVEGSGLRDNQSRMAQLELFFKTAFDISINFQNNISFSENLSSAQNQDAFINRSWNNRFGILLKPNKHWFASIKIDYFLPNASQTQNDFTFLSSTVRFRPENKNWQYNLSANNLLDVDAFEQVSVNDFSNSNYRSTLLRRHFLFSVSYSF